MTQNKGFAMADAIVALIVVSTFASSLIASNTIMTGSLEKSTARFEAALIARALTRSQSVEDNGSATRDGTTYGWARQVTDSKDSHVLKDVSIVVTWDEHGRQRSLRVDTVWRGLPHDT